jgi:CopG family nickel-responsive transcriptional regulator
MERVTLTLDDELLSQLDRHMKANGYENRSEVVRDLVRAGLQQAAHEQRAGGPCIGAIMYVYDHRVRELSKRLTSSFHHEHDLSLASLHVHLDEETCMEISLIKGSASRVRHFAEHVIAERGVRYGRLFTIPAPRPRRREGQS